MTEWEVKDINGDGYPDVVFSSSRAMIDVWVVSDGRQPPDLPQVGGRDPAPQVGGVTGVAIDRHWLRPTAGSNKIEAVFNILGTRLTDGNDEAFSAPVTLGSDRVPSDQCGIDQWFPDTSITQHLECGIVDVNGDGIVDRVTGTSVFLGTGNTAAESFFTSSAMLTLPGPLAVQANDRRGACSPPADGNTEFLMVQQAGLHDVTGDGIPDYLSRAGDVWNVSIGTGTGFVNPKPINGSFELSYQRGNCGGTASFTVSGLSDIDGDGRSDLILGTPCFFLAARAHSEFPALAA